jgi:membrane-associated phospholipid phosphatase
VIGSAISALASVPLSAGVGAFMLLLAAIMGLLIAHHQASDVIDAWGLVLLPARPDSITYHDVAQLASAPALVVGIVGAALLTVRRDPRRAAACVAGPLLAILVTEHVVKPLVARQLVMGNDSYPSGTITAVAAVAVAVVLVTRRPARPIVAVVAAGTIAAICIAVVGMRWHYPTDALGGVCIGAGTMLVVDAALHVPARIRARRKPAPAHHGAV